MQWPISEHLSNRPHTSTKTSFLQFSRLVSEQQPLGPAAKMTQRHLVVMTSAWTPATSQTKSRSNKAPNFYDSWTVWSSQDSACHLPELNLPLPSIQDTTKIKRLWTEKEQCKHLSDRHSSRNYTHLKGRALLPKQRRTVWNILLMPTVTTLRYYQNDAIIW